MTMQLGLLDWLVVALFVAAILGLGFSASLQKSSLLQYLVAGRNLSLPAFVATLVSTWYGGILGVGETVSFYGLGAWVLIGVPFYIFAILYALFLAPRVREGEQISLPERMASRWGAPVAILSATLLFLLAVPAAHVLMVGSLVTQVTGLSLEPAIWLAALLGLALLYRGGLLADVRMSLLAFVLMYVGFAAVAFVCLTRFPPSQTFAQFEPPELLTFTGGVGWPMILSFMILGAWTFVDPAFHQRVASARTARAGRLGVLVSVFFWVLFDVLSITTALYALALLDPLPAGLAVYPALGEHVLPPGLKGLFLCGMLGTIVSAMVGYTLVSGATIGREIVARLRREGEDSGVRRWTQVGLVLALVVAVQLALRIGSVVDLWYAWAGAVVGAMVLPVILAYSRPERQKVQPSYVFISMALAATSSLAWLVYGRRTENPFLEVHLLKIDDRWKFALPPVSESALAQASEVAALSIGTLLPGLVISAIVLGIGQVVGGMRKG
jgi:solute:Na+ symporter, SSS family